MIGLAVSILFQIVVLSALKQADPFVCQALYASFIKCHYCGVLSKQVDALMMNSQ